MNTMEDKVAKLNGKNEFNDVDKLTEEALEEVWDNPKDAQAWTKYYATAEKI